MSDLYTIRYNIIWICCVRMIIRETLIIQFGESLSNTNGKYYLENPILRDECGNEISIYESVCVIENFSNFQAVWMESARQSEAHPESFDTQNFPEIPSSSAPKVTFVLVLLIGSMCFSPWRHDETKQIAWQALTNPIHKISWILDTFRVGQTNLRR